MAPIKPTLHHVMMKTSHLDGMIAWYAPVIGAQVQLRDQAAAWMTNDEANHRIGFLAVPGLGNDAEKVRHNGMHHCAFEYGPRRKFRRTAKRQFFGLAARRKERPNGR